MVLRSVRERVHGVDGLRAVSDPEAENYVRHLLSRTASGTDTRGYLSR